MILTDRFSDTDVNQDFNADILHEMIDRLPSGMAEQLFDKLSQECDRLTNVLKDQTLDKSDTTNAAHEFKGMLSNFGLVHASKIAAEIENSQKPSNEIAENVDRLEKSVAQGMQQVEEILRNKDD